MALMTTLRNFPKTINGDLKAVTALLDRISLAINTNQISSDFKKYGHVFGAQEFSKFIKLAETFYENGIHSIDPSYSIIYLPDNSIAMDYMGDIRGVYSSKGKPISFFRPDFRAFGYLSKFGEIDAFRSGKDLFPI